MSEPDEQPEPKSTLYCSFCGKSQHEVRKLIAGPTVFICNECVALCLPLIRERKMLPYPIMISSDDSGSYLVTCPALPEVSTFGNAGDEIIHVAALAIEEAVAARRARGEEVPEPLAKARA